MESEKCKRESIGQLNVQITGRRKFEECSRNATDALPQDSRRRMGSGRHSYPSQSAMMVSQ